MELQTVFARPGEIVLLDGRLPNLSRFIKRTHDSCPNVHIVVASDADSLPEEPLSSIGVHYIPGSVPPRELVKEIRKLGSAGPS